MKLNKIKANPDNPRVLRDDKFDKLKKSLTEFPEMMEKRPIVIDENGVILGGNMRFRVLQEIYGKNGEIPDNWVSRAEGWSEEKKKEFIIKDNVAFGEWDFDVLVANWDTELLVDWGVSDWGMTEAQDGVELADLGIETIPTQGESKSGMSSITFVFTIEAAALVNAWIEANSKEMLAAKIVELCQDAEAK